jgi:putative peptide maturation system protein
MEGDRTMSDDDLREAIGDVLALLEALRAERAGTDEAMSRLSAIGRRHPRYWFNMVWERETLGESLHYDVLVGAERGTYSLSYCADEETPWAVRGTQRINESLVVRVDDEPVFIHQAITSLDHAWHTLHIGRHLVDTSLIERELTRDPIDVSDDDLAEALTRFRRRRGLFSVAQVERWLREHGTSQVQLESHLRGEVAQEQLRRRVAAGREEEYFRDHRAGFDRAHVARIEVAERDLAERLHDRLRREPAMFLQAAQERFLAGGGEESLFVTLSRRELGAEAAGAVFAAEPGQVVGPIASGEGHALVQVLRVLPAELDAATRQEIQGILFEEWLEERRRAARVEWFWGAAEAAEIPAAAL